MRLRLSDRDAVAAVRALSHRAAELRIAEARHRDPVAGQEAAEIEAVICRFPTTVTDELRRLRRPPLRPRTTLR